MSSWSFRVLVLLVAVAMAGVAAWLCRFEVLAVPRADGNGYVYRLDRWTGEMKWFRGEDAGTSKESN